MRHSPHLGLPDEGSQVAVAFLLLLLTPGPRHQGEQARAPGGQAVHVRGVQQVFRQPEEPPGAHIRDTRGQARPVPLRHLPQSLSEEEKHGKTQECSSP